MLLPIVGSSLLGLLGCASTPADTPQAPGAQTTASVTASGASPDKAADDVDLTRPGTEPPKYKPSSRSPHPVPITTNAYGASQQAPHAPGLGDVAEGFELPLADGGTFSLEQARKAGPVLVMFYRGFW